MKRKILLVLLACLVQINLISFPVMGASLNFGNPVPFDEFLYKREVAPPSVPDSIKEAAPIPEPVQMPPVKATESPSQPVAPPPAAAPEKTIISETPAASPVSAPAETPAEDLGAQEVLVPPTAEGPLMPEAEPSPAGIQTAGEMELFISDYIQWRFSQLPEKPETFQIKSTAGFFKAPSIAKGSLGSLKAGDTVKVISTDLGWSQVEFNGKTGYVYERLIDFGAYDKQALKKEALGKFQLLASYETSFTGNQNNRNHNMEKASYANSKYYGPGEIASFNGNTGNSSTAASGYLLAGALAAGKPTTAYGGGICQVSSTIFNAVDKAEGIVITQRRGHSASVGYVPAGRDATVSYGSIDFKFRNDRKTPVYVDCFTDLIANKVTVTVYGL